MIHTTDWKDCKNCPGIKAHVHNAGLCLDCYIKSLEKKVTNQRKELARLLQDKKLHETTHLERANKELGKKLWSAKKWSKLWKRYAIHVISNARYYGK